MPRTYKVVKYKQNNKNLQYAGEEGGITRLSFAQELANHWTKLPNEENACNTEFFAIVLVETDGDDFTEFLPSVNPGWYVSFHLMGATIDNPLSTEANRP